MVLVAVLLFFIPLAHYELAEGGVKWSLGGFDQPGVFMPESVGFMLLPGIFAGLSAVISLIVVMLFRQRMLQIRLSRINMIVIILLIASLFYVTDQIRGSDEVVRFAYLHGAYLSLLLPLLNYLTIGAIRNDERKVRAADRLR